MNRWQEKNKDENFKNNSNVSTVCKNTLKQKPQEPTVMNSILIVKKEWGVGDNSGRDRTEVRD